MSQINISTAFDNNYCSVVSVMLASLVAHTNPNNYYMIYLLQKDVILENKLYINSIASRFSNVSFVWVDCSDVIEEYLEDVYTTRQVSEATYYRLFMPYILNDLDEVVYIDGDCVVLKDVAELYGIDLEDNAVAAATEMALSDLSHVKTSAPFDVEAFGDFSTKYDYQRNFMRLSDDEIGRYFNAGVLKLDLNKLRRQNWSERIREKLGYKFMYHDQDILNLLLKDDLKLITHLWNCPNAMLEKVTANEDMPFIIHSYMTIHGKPWFSRATFGADLYWQYLRATPYYDESFIKYLRKGNFFKCPPASNAASNIFLTSDQRKAKKLMNKPILFFFDMIKKRVGLK